MKKTSQTSTFDIIKKPKFHQKFDFLPVCENEWTGLFLTTYCVQYPQAVPLLRNEVLSTKNSKNTCRLGGCSVLNALNLEKMRGKSSQLRLLLDFIALFWLYCSHPPFL